MKNNYFTEKPKLGFLVFMMVFCCLFANGLSAQDTFTWTGTVSNNWATAGNWSKTGTASGDGFPGQTLGRKLDIVAIANGGSPVVAPNANAYGMLRLTISNNSTVPAGSTLTINSGAILEVGGAASNNVVLNGGNLINNGALNISSSGAGFTSFPVYGFNCGNPTFVPTVPTEFGYSGSGTLSISLSAANFASSALVGVVGTTTTNATYKMVFNNPTVSYNQASVATIGAFRVNGGATGCRLLIGGSMTVGTTIGYFISLGAGANVTVDTGANLTFNSAAANTSALIGSFSSSATATNFTNKGTVNLLGASSRPAIGLSSGASGTATVFNISNEGTFNANLSCVRSGDGVLSITNGGGGTANASTAVNFSNTGTMTLKNTAATAGTGFSIYMVNAGETAPLIFTNSGTLNLDGTVYSFGPKATINNTGIINSNSELRSFAAINNNVGGSINFVKTAATATSRQVVFNGLLAADLSGAIGSVYTDGTNNYTVIIQKFGSGTTLVANVLSSATVGTGVGSLSIVSGGSTSPIAFSSVSIPALNGALLSTTTNSGTINTGTAANLNVISEVTTTSTSIIAPGGSAGKGIADFAKAAATLTGKTILQISGDATAGVDYDQITNSAIGGTLSVAGTLDITGIYTPAGPVTIDIVTTEASGSLSGAFSSNVIGITAGWSVLTTTGTAGKVQLVYDPSTPATSTTWTGVGGTTGWNLATNWDNGVPTQNSNVIIGSATFQPSPFVNVSIKSLTIASGATLQVNATYNLTVKEAIVNNGTLTIQNNANLIQVDNVANTGTGITNVIRNSNALKRLDFTIWSSPVTNASQFLTTFSPSTSLNRFFSYNQTTNAYNEITTPAATQFAAGTGYLIRMPNDHPATPLIWSGSFSGVPNNGTINKLIDYNGSAPFGYNMVGNPYPSTIDAPAFITANTANIESSLYFWRKVNGATGSAYAVYNPMGSTIASPSSAVPNGTIQVGQGFFVKAKLTSSVNFTNAMRVANTGNQFFKTRAAQKDRLWVNLTNASGAFSQALVGYTADATIGVDMYDAKYIDDSPVALSSSINGDEFTIQGRPAFDASDVVALNFKTDADVDYTIAIDHADGVFATGQDVYLVDSKTGAETNLKTGSYTFTAAKGVDNARFSLIYQKTLKVDATSFNENSVRVYKNNGSLFVNSGSIAISNIKIFDIQGRLIAEQKNLKATSAVFNNLKATNQVLIVKIAAEDNSVVSKKIMN